MTTIEVTSSNPTSIDITVDSNNTPINVTVGETVLGVTAQLTTVDPAVITMIQEAEADRLEASHWANHPVDTLVPEGDGVDDYSALHHAAKAAGSATTAGTRANDANNSANSALASENKAFKWAEEAVDIAVETGKYSAKHYAQKAADSAATASNNLVLKGGWDASTGTDPALPTDSHVHWYRITVAGTLPSVGAVGVGDAIYSNVDATSWWKVDNTDAVTSVAGRTGAVTLGIADISNLQTSLDGKASLAGDTFTGGIYFADTVDSSATNVDAHIRLYGAGGTSTDNYGIGITAGTLNLVARSGTGIVDAQGTLREKGNNVWHAGNLDPATKADLGGAAFTGSISAPNLQQWRTSRTLPVALDECVDIGHIDLQNGAHSLSVSITVSDSGFSVSKKYLITSQYDGSTTSGWKIVAPISSTGAYSGQDFSLEADQSGKQLFLRIRRTVGTLAGVAKIFIANESDVATVFTESSTKAAIAAVTEYYPTAILEQRGNVAYVNGNAVHHAGNFNPATKANLSGATFTGSVQVGDWVFGTTAAGDGTLGGSYFHTFHSEPDAVTGHNYIHLYPSHSYGKTSTTYYRVGDADGATADGKWKLAWSLDKSAANFRVPLQQSGNQVWHAGNFDPATKANLSGATFTGIVTVNPNVGSTLKLKGGSANHAYLELYPRTDTSIRGGYLGYAGGATENLSLVNEFANGNIILKTRKVQFNADSLFTGTNTFHGGDFTVKQVADPAAPTVANVGTTGTTTYTYYVVAEDKTGKKTLASAGGSTTTGNATLDATNYNTVSFAWPVQAVKMYVLKGGTGGTVLLAAVTNTATTSVNDQGQALSAFTAVTRNATGDVTVDGDLAVASVNNLGFPSTTRNNEANKIVRTQANGYAEFGWINTTSGETTATIARIYASNDAYLRYVTPATFRSQVTDGSYLGRAHSVWQTTTDGVQRFHFSNGGNTYYKCGGTGAHVWRNGGNVDRMILNDAGNLYCDGVITGGYSDERLKESLGNIEGALDIVCGLDGFRYKNNEIAKSFGYNSDEVQIGLAAGQVKEKLPELVDRAPFDIEIVENEDGTTTHKSKSGEDYMTVQYDRVVAVLVEAIKELRAEVEALKAGGGK